MMKQDGEFVTRHDKLVFIIQMSQLKMKAELKWVKEVWRSQCFVSCGAPMLSPPCTGSKQRRGVNFL